MAKERTRKANAQKTAPAEQKWHWWYSLQLVSFGGDDERDYILEYLALLIRSGMEVTVALKAIEEEMQNPALRFRVWQIRQELESGARLSEAFEQSKLFSAQVISLMRVGEDSGRLPENLLAIVEQQQKNRAFKSQIRSASMYPAFVISITGIVGVGVAWFVLPQLANVFSSLDMDLPLVTRVVIGLGQFLSEYGYIVLPSLLAVFFIALYIVFFFKKTKFIGQWILFGTPGVRRLIQEVELSRLGYVMGSLLEAGLPIDESLVALEEATGMYRYRNLYAHALKSTLAGHTFEDIFDEVKHSRRLIPSPIQQMIITGERSASLPSTFLRVGKVFEEKSASTTKNLSVILEPLLLIIVWLGVASVALAVILPVYSLVGNITNQPGVNQRESTRAIEVSEPLVEKETEPVPVEELIEEEVNETPEPEPVTAEQTGVVASDSGLNMRQEPLPGAPVLAILDPGQEVRVLEETDAGWLRVAANDLEGWVSALYVER